MGKEIRNLKTPVTVEKREDGTIKSIVGYPIVYNRNSEDMGYIEQIAPGAATSALKKSDVRGLKNHDSSLIFARTGVNLTLTEDKDGVRMEATPLDTHNFRETAKEVDAGLLDGQSFAFNIKADEWKDLDTDHPTRTITEFEMIYDVGPVTFPAYPDTNVGLRTLEEARKSAKEVIPDDNNYKIRIIMDTTDGSTPDEHVFTGESRFDDASDKIKSLRSDAKPKLPAPEITPDPKIDDELTVIDEVCEEMNDLITRLRK